jgi:hypothetical protein
LLHHLDAKNAESFADIFDISDSYLLQKWGKLIEGIICGVIYPGPNENTIVWLQLEILRDVINYQRLRNVSPQT